MERTQIETTRCETSDCLVPPAFRDVTPQNARGAHVPPQPADRDSQGWFSWWQL
jgi:hypothetical protein